jgi:DNA-binding NarL/FixJ family response regulator
VRVILADDAAVIRQGVGRMLSDHGFEVIAQASDAAELMAQVARQQPDVAIVDIRMPPTFRDEGLIAARAIRSRHPDVGVLVLSQYIDVAYALELVSGDEHGIGYLLKDRITDIAQLASALERITAGGLVVDPTLVEELVSGPQIRDRLDHLTTREREVLAQVAEGHTDGGIARELFITPKTVEAHVRSIFRKLDLPTDATANRRVHAVLVFLRARA